ncbi:DUF2785 domain-containing protein [Dictyobacter formicarum]|uniref:DUF2785 domain-containing protein n=1 Tax=Dictyobacter formicarum TaxID=2778368 RepID=A0ABQ3VSA5_9CHLR|nr:DUF2785 domain-containing protein [Dictyobacter formicarum]GHO88463.1 hypothetical protein KSZ_64690 [Dictyobacter formicarum]
MDKLFWGSIARNHFQVPAGYSVEQLTPELLHRLGEPDPELRDYYIYSTLENWIQEGFYNHAALRSMIMQLAENMRHELGTQGDDTVLLRSFSALTLSDVLKYDNKHPFLARSEVHGILEQAIDYLVSEQDLRGYVTGKGWLHALAHAGDLLGVLARNRHIGDVELKRMMAAIAERVTLPTDYSYMTLEEERLALVVIAALTRDILSPTFWPWWGRQMAQVEERMRWEDTVRFAQPPDICAYHNTKLFLHSLYFQLTITGYKMRGTQELVETIRQTLNRLDPGFFSADVIKILDADIHTEDLT